MKKTAADLFVQVPINKSFAGMHWTSDKAAFEVESGDAVKVPDVDRGQIIQALMAGDRPITEANILTLYRRQKGLM